MAKGRKKKGSITEGRLQVQIGKQAELVLQAKEALTRTAESWTDSISSDDDLKAAVAAYRTARSKLDGMEAALAVLFPD